MRILLIHPPMDFYPQESFSIVPPLGLAYIAAVLEKAGHEVKILDCWAISWRKPLLIKVGGKIIRRLSPGRKFITAYLRDFQPQLVGISNLVAPTELETLKLANLVKRTLPQTSVVVGGCNASARATVLIKNKNIDFVVVREGEETIIENGDPVMQKRIGKINPALKADFDTASFFIALPLPGAKVYKEIFKDSEPKVNQLRVYVSKTQCSELSQTQVRRLIKSFFRQFFFFRLKRELQPGSMINRISHWRSFADFTFQWRNFKRFLQIQTI